MGWLPLTCDLLPWGRNLAISTFKHFLASSVSGGSQNIGSSFTHRHRRHRTLVSGYRRGEVNLHSENATACPLLTVANLPSHGL